MDAKNEPAGFGRHAPTDLFKATFVFFLPMTTYCLCVSAVPQHVCGKYFGQIQSAKGCQLWVQFRKGRSKQTNNCPFSSRHHYIPSLSLCVCVLHSLSITHTQMTTTTCIHTYNVYIHDSSSTTVQPCLGSHENTKVHLQGRQKKKNDNNNRVNHSRQTLIRLHPEKDGFVPHAPFLGIQTGAWSLRARKSRIRVCDSQPSAEVRWTGGIQRTSGTIA